MKSSGRRQSKANQPAVPRSFGYSGTPLIQKLGIKSGTRIQFVSAPPQLPDLLGPLPAGVTSATRGKLDFAVLFAESFLYLAKHFSGLRDRLESNGMMWVAWPKKASGKATDLTETVVRDYGLSNGLVDVKVCAIDETWSGLKFVRRLSDR